MERSGEQGRRDIPLGVVVKVCFYTILIDILCLLFSFVFGIVNILLAGMTGLCVRLQNLRESGEIEIGPENFPVVDEDFKDDSANLMDPHDTSTSTSESDDDSPISVSSKTIRANIPEEGTADVEEKEIGYEKSSLSGEDFKDDSANLIDPHDTSTSTSESDDDSPISVSSKIRDGIPEKGPEEEKKIGQEKSSLSGEDFKDDSALRVVHNVTDTSPPEAKDNTTSYTSSKTNVADTPEEDSESEANSTIIRGNDTST